MFNFMRQRIPDRRDTRRVSNGHNTQNAQNLPVGLRVVVVVLALVVAWVAQVCFRWLS